MSALPARKESAQRAAIIPFPKHDKYPISDCPVRPFHLWHANEKHALQWRYYSDPKRAHLGALIEARWAAIGVTIEVFDTRTGRLLGQYTRRVHSVEFLGGDSYANK